MCPYKKEAEKSDTQREEKTHQRGKAVWPWSQVDPASPEAGQKGKQ